MNMTIIFFCLYIFMKVLSAIDIIQKCQMQNQWKAAEKKKGGGDCHIEIVTDVIAWAMFNSFT